MRQTAETRLRRSCSLIADKLQMALKWRDDAEIAHYKALLRKKQARLDSIVRRRFDDKNP